jgi:hypothetical protein
MCSKAEKGAVLIAVLWICAVISWIALSYAAKERFDAESQRLRIEKTKSHYLALSGAHEILARMAGSDSGPMRRRGGLRPDGKPRRIDFSMGHCLVRVENELEKVNVNLASRRELEMVLDEAGYEDEAAGLAFEINANIRPVKNDGMACSPCGPLETIEQMVLYRGVDTEMFYGKAYRFEGLSEQRRTPLFDLFTVVGERSRMRVDEGVPAPEFEDGGVYRIVSVGRVAEESAASAVWLVIKLSQNSLYGYELLYRKVL